MKYKENKTIQDIIPDFVSEDYFSTQSLKRAVWQYLIDHSQIVDDKGLLKFYFYIPTETEFWRRVKARDDGVYKRKDLSNLRKIEEKKHKTIQELRKIKNKFEMQESDRVRWEARIRKKEETGTLKERTLLKLSKMMRKTARNLTNYVLIKNK